LFDLVEDSSAERYAVVFQQEGSPGTKAASIFIFNPLCDSVVVNVTSPAQPGTLKFDAFLQKNQAVTVPVAAANFMLDGSGTDNNRGKWAMPICRKYDGH
jgi:hypothetical protein